MEIQISRALSFKPHPWKFYLNNSLNFVWRVNNLKRKISNYLSSEKHFLGHVNNDARRYRHQRDPWSFELKKHFSLIHKNLYMEERIFHLHFVRYASSIKEAFFLFCALFTEIFFFFFHSFFRSSLKRCFFISIEGKSLPIEINIPKRFVNEGNCNILHWRVAKRGSEEKVVSWFPLFCLLWLWKKKKKTWEKIVAKGTATNLMSSDIKNLMILRSNFKRI